MHYVPYEHSSNVQLLAFSGIRSTGYKEIIGLHTPIQKATLQDACSVSSDQYGHSWGSVSQV